VSHRKPDGAVHLVKNRLSKGWLLAVLVILLAQAAFIKIITTEKVPAPLPSAELDDQGRAIIFLGDLKLHIPEHHWGRSSPPRKTEREYFPLLLCWQNGLTPWTRECPRHAIVKPFLLAWPATSYPYTGDANKHLERRTNTRDGPFDSEIEGVIFYRHPTSGFKTSYALTTIDQSGIFPFVSCNFDCRVQTRVHTQLHIQYHFDKELIANWPQIHYEIRGIAESMIPRE